MNTIQLQLELAEVNKILNALGALPFSEVYQLIEKIQRQATAQLDDAEQPRSVSPSDRLSATE